MKIAIVGPGRSGKDAVADWLRDHTTLRYSYATSWPIAVYRAKKHGTTPEWEFANRHGNREGFFLDGNEMRKADAAALARDVLAAGDICVGVRSRGEIEAAVAERLVDLVVWVDRPAVLADPTLEYGPEFADVILPNWWGLDDLYDRVERLAWAWGVAR